MSTHGLNKTDEILILKAFKEAKETCSSPWVLNYHNHLPGIPITLQELMVILGAVACIISVGITLFLISGHVLHWTTPKEQKQIVRVLLFVPFFSITAFFSVWFYAASGFLAPVGAYYEGFAITALFLFYVSVLEPDESRRALFFHRLERRWYNGKRKGDGGSLRWFKIIWILVFQITITRIGTLIAIETLYSWTCPLSPARGYGEIVANVIQSVSTGFAVYAVITFEKRMSKHLTEHKSLFKLVSFKGVVVFQSAQSIIFPALAESEVFFPTPPYYLSYKDFAVGIPNFLLVWEMLVVAIMFLWSFDFKMYMLATRQGVPVVATPIRAFFSALDLTDIWRGCVYPFTSLGPSSISMEERDHGVGMATRVVEREDEESGALHKR